MTKILSHEVEPSHYDLFVDVQDEKFKGTVKMMLHANTSVQSFKFNSRNLDLSDLLIKHEENLINASFKNENDIVEVLLEKSIKDDFTLEIKFEGKYTQSMEGFYKSFYKGSNFFSTHFEPADARQAFPCFDQPDMKATFAISIKAPEGFTALSNGALKEKKDNLFIFETTPKMSTYIVAYVIGKIDYIEDNSYIPIRVYADPEEKQWGKFALDTAVKCLQFFEKYFKIKYPLPKLDMVAVPSFAMGAMENWGLVTYRKTSLLFDETSTSIRSKKNIAVTVCHELAHMWFGNLVTMKWWDDLWLNEGFATWAATLAIVDGLQDLMSWDAWTSFINDEIQSGMELDSIKSTHKIGIKVKDPVEIDQIFDAISYSKGSSVIKMVENWLGPEVFRKGLIHYLNKYSYSNSTTQDLWDSLSHVANQHSNTKINVAAVIDPWIQREGFPLVKVVDLGKKLKISQERFTMGFKSQEEMPWPIPIKISWINNNNDLEVFVMTEDSVEITKKSEIYKINDDFSGFYRVLYPNDLDREIIAKVSSPVDKINICFDAFALTFAHQKSIQSSLKIVDALRGNDNYEILLAAFGYLGRIKSIFYDCQDKVDYINSKILNLISEQLTEIDLADYPTDLNTGSLKSLLISQALVAEHHETIEKLRQVDVSKINPEYMRQCFIARANSEFDSIYKLYLKSQKPGEKQHALFALGRTMVKENIEFIFKNITQFEPHDSIYLFISLGSNLKFRNIISELFIQNFEVIRGHILNASLIRHAIKGICSEVTEGRYKDNVIAFLTSISSDEELKSAVENTRDSIVVALEMREKYLKIDFE